MCERYDTLLQPILFTYLCSNITSFNNMFCFLASTIGYRLRIKVDGCQDDWPAVFSRVIWLVQKHFAHTTWPPGVPMLTSRHLILVQGRGYTTKAHALLP